MNRTIMICLAVQLVALGLTACTQAVSKAAAEQSAVPGDANSAEQNVLPESTEPPAPEMIDFEVNRYAVTAGAAAYLGGAEEQYKALVDAVCSKKETEPYTDEDLNYNNDNSRVSREHEDESLRNVELVADTVENWDDYDTVFIVVSFCRVISLRSLSICYFD
mgnify:CR=1 FL=1